MSLVTQLLKNVPKSIFIHEKIREIKIMLMQRSEFFSYLDKAHICFLRDQYQSMMSSLLNAKSIDMNEIAMFKIILRQAKIYHAFLFLQQACSRNNGNNLPDITMFMSTKEKDSLATLQSDGINYEPIMNESSVFIDDLEKSIHRLSSQGLSIFSGSACLKNSRSFTC